MITEKYAQQAEMQVAQMMAAASDPNDLLSTQGYAAVAATFDQMMAETTDTAVLAGYYDEFMPATVSGSTLVDTLATLGSVNYDSPTAIHIYANSFEDKEHIDDVIVSYNAGVSEEDQIQYTDYIAIIMSGVTTMIDAVSYGLIGFVSISLVVSSIMIGIITYISVLERTKEIGILRSVGASKRRFPGVQGRNHHCRICSGADWNWGYDITESPNQHHCRKTDRNQRYCRSTCPGSL